MNIKNLFDELHFARLHLGGVLLELVEHPASALLVLLFVAVEVVEVLGLLLVLVSHLWCCVVVVVSR